MFGKKIKHIFDFSEIKKNKDKLDNTQQENIEIDSKNISDFWDETLNPIEDISINEQDLVNDSITVIKINEDNNILEENTKSEDTSNTFPLPKRNVLKEISIKITKIVSQLLSSIINYTNIKGYKIDKKLLVFHLNESLKTIILLIISLVWLLQAYNTYKAVDKLDIIKKHYELKKAIKIEDEKIKENIKAEYLADILKFWVKTENWRYPEWWYLEALNQIFPENISDLQLLTFLEGWGSEFIDYKWRKIRVDNWLIKTFKQDNFIEDNWLLKGYKYKLVLEWEPSKIDNFLYNIKYSNKIPKYFTKINKKYNSTKWLLTVDMDVLFYLSK